MNNLDLLLEKFVAALKQQNPDHASSFMEWTLRKLELHTSSFHLNHPILLRGVYWIDFGVNIGSEINKVRPGIVIWHSSDFSQAVVIPLTSKKYNDHYSYHIDIIELNNTAMLEQIRLISTMRILKPLRREGRIYKINPVLMKQISDVCIHQIL
jgi:mRNA-degrading endonuclease toxin of MazEF toxin-antitoxin module